MTILVEDIRPGMKVQCKDGSIPCLEDWIEQIVMTEISTGRPFIICDMGTHYLDDPEHPHGAELKGLEVVE